MNLEREALTNRVSYYDQTVVQSSIYIGDKYSLLHLGTRKATWTSFLQQAKTENGKAPVVFQLFYRGHFRRRVPSLIH